MARNLQFKFGRGLALVLTLNILGGFLVGGLLVVIRHELTALSQEYRYQKEVAENLANANQIAEMHRAIAPSAAAIDSYFIPEASLPMLIGGVEQLAKASGIDFKFQDFDDQPKPGNLQMKIQARGRFGDLLQFAGLLSNAPMSLRFDDVSLAAEGVSASLWVADISFTVLSYEPSAEREWALTL